MKHNVELLQVLKEDLSRKVNVHVVIKSVSRIKVKK